jgi:hypothetical protein
MSLGVVGIGPDDDADHRRHLLAFVPEETPEIGLDVA